jgi:UDP-N-acetylmuramate--alanine ligase
MQMPAKIGTVHIVGIGGIGMSAIAEILHAKGYIAQGSDQKESANVKRLSSIWWVPSMLSSPPP